MSGCNNLMQGASMYFDTALRPFVMTLPLYIQDTKDTVVKLEIMVHDKVYLSSLDLELLYTNITQELGLKAIKNFLDSRSIYLQKNKLILLLLRFVLTHNFFIFYATFYQQKCVTHRVLGWWEIAFYFLMI